MLDTDGALAEERAFTSAAFCNPEAGLAVLLSLTSATQCDIQTRAVGSNTYLYSRSSRVLEHESCGITQT